MQEIKDKREEKLKLLDQEFNRSENSLTRQVQREDMAARERQAAAQLASTEKLTLSGQNIQKTIAEQQIKNAKDIAELGEAGATERSKAQIEAGKDLANMQIDAAQQLGITPKTTSDGKTIWVRPDGTRVNGPKDEKGNEIDLALSDTDTPEIKNFKFMKTLGIEDADAMSKLLSSKNADPALMYVSLMESFTKAQTTFGNADQEVFENADKWSRAALKNAGHKLPDNFETPDALKPDAFENVVIPQDWTTSRIKQAIDAAIQDGAKPESLKKALIKNKRNPADFGL